MKKIKSYLIFLTIFISLSILLVSCSNKSHRIDLFGSNIPSAGISKSLPRVAPGKNLSSKALTVPYQKHLDSLLENELVKVDALHLYQNGDSYEPLLRMLDTSQKYFYMNVLSFTCDDTTEKMVQLLESKSRAGVDIRLIVNRGFSYVSLPCLKRLEKAGISIVKAKTHSSYFLNDQEELMIGSQSVARMFFLADGFNNLDRDMMLYSKGALATGAYKDFLSIWIEEEGKGVKKSPDKYALEIKHYQELLKSDNEKKIKGAALYGKNNIEPTKMCRFVSERPKLGIKDIQSLWLDLIDSNEKELFFSGVRVETGNGILGEKLKDKSRNGVDTHYLGNGYDSGNGELTMVVMEWIAGLKKGPFAFFVPLLESINVWDKTRLAVKNQKLYDSLKDNSAINIWAYFNYIHYKIFLFDHPGFFVGSANLDESTFGVMYDAGVYCLDSKIHNELKVQLLRDRLNSVLYLPKVTAKKNTKVSK